MNEVRAEATVTMSLSLRVDILAFHCGNVASSPLITVGVMRLNSLLAVIWMQSPCMST